MRHVPHEITLIAMIRDGEGQSVADIVETSNRNAPKFARAWLKDPQIASIGTARPGVSVSDFNWRDIRPAEDLTPEGIQLVIPGAERVQPVTQRQGELF